MTTALQLDERYGRTRRRRWPWFLAGAVALLLLAALAWSTVSQSMSSVDADDLGFELVDEHAVDLRFQVTGVQGKDVVCVLEALDEEFGVVGWKIVEVPAGDAHSLTRAERIPTVAEATTGLVNTCWVA
ncbi:DUF4307 domain-containing protein [Microbacterium sp. NPDC079208]|uniref:DUF4307 domain-containing protein n=1 Tax=Microbacterium sp. NPDC079208 TaxID=3154652 RepID=UPI00344FDD9C